MGETEILAQYLTDLNYSSIPSNILEEMKVLLFDYLGVTLGGQGLRAEESLPNSLRTLEKKGRRRSLDLGIAFQLPVPLLRMRSSLIALNWMMSITFPISVSAPLVINLFKGGKTPLVPIQQLEEWGYRIAIVPSSPQLAAIKAMQELLKILREQGTPEPYSEGMVTFQERDEIEGHPKFQKWEQRFLGSRWKP